MALCVCESLDAGLFYLASLLAVPPRDEAVVECGGGGQYVVGVGRHEGGREGGGVVREEVSRRGLAGAVDGAVGVPLCQKGRVILPVRLLPPHQWQS